MQTWHCGSPQWYSGRTHTQLCSGQTSAGQETSQPSQQLVGAPASPGSPQPSKGAGLSGQGSPWPPPSGCSRSQREPVWELGPWLHPVVSLLHECPALLPTWPGCVRSPYCPEAAPNHSGWTLARCQKLCLLDKAVAGGPTPLPFPSHTAYSCQHPQGSLGTASTTLRLRTLRAPLTVPQIPAG